jgi:hypothetical protein
VAVSSGSVRSGRLLYFAAVRPTLTSSVDSHTARGDLANLPELRAHDLAKLSLTPRDSPPGPASDWPSWHGSGTRPLSMTPSNVQGTIMAVH